MILAGIAAILAATIIVKIVDLHRFQNTTAIFLADKGSGEILQKKEKKKTLIVRRKNEPIIVLCERTPGKKERPDVRCNRLRIFVFDNASTSGHSYDAVQ